MKKIKQEELISLIVIIIIVCIGLYLLSQNRQKVHRAECIEKCIYLVKNENKELGSNIDRLFNPKRLESVWNFNDRNFETQAQCIEYCLIKK